MAQKILLLDDMDQDGKDYLTSHGCEVEVAEAKTEEERVKAIRDADPAGIVVKTGTAVTKEMIEAAPSLQIVARHGVGYDNIDIAAASMHKVWVVHVPDGNFVSVAEHAMFLILALAKRYGFISDKFRKGDFAVRQTIIGEELAGKTLGLVGTGHIGSELAKIAVGGFSMKALGYSRHSKKGDVTEEGIVMAGSREEVLSEADFAVLCLPSTPQTRHSIGFRELSSMKKTAYFINVARGDIVVEKDLLRAIQEGVIAGAGLDVFDPEPPAKDNPLLSMDNVIVTPHYAAITADSLRRVARSCAVQIIQALSGEKPEWPLN